MKAALSLDLDNKWSYMKTHGDAGWESFPTYLDVLIPQALRIMGDLGVRITFFVVGQDAAIERNHDALAQIAPAGHEIGNHSFHHEPWMHRHSHADIDDELARAEESIAAAAGHMPRGFRGPGFVKSSTLIDVLASRGYLYDASSLPTFIGPLARAYYFRSARLEGRDLDERHDLFGQFTDGFARNRPYRMYSGTRSIEEIPVTTMPGLRLPIHVSYVLYIATVSAALALAYFRAALTLCALTSTAPSILLHPLDFLSERDCPELRFFPGMTLDPGVKRELLLRVLHELAARFDVVPLERFTISQHAAAGPYGGVAAS
ncbi:MAG TPA: polysaccharide deacetylase family protein [Candidatus Baltobacteraceae bacterium]|nr:polysaccharide deacetylase family protein [Candidatus Baltobacteraceae bacterium]